MNLKDLRTVAKSIRDYPFEDGMYTIEASLEEVEDLPGFVYRHEYANLVAKYRNEIGACEMFRFVDPHLCTHRNTAPFIYDAGFGDKFVMRCNDCGAARRAGDGDEWIDNVYGIGFDHAAGCYICCAHTVVY